MAGAPPPIYASTLPNPSPKRYSAQSTASSTASPAPSSSTATLTHRPVIGSRKSIYDRNLNRSRAAELSRSSFSFLFMEMVLYAQKRVTGIADLERRLNEQGYPLGLKLLDLILYRSTPAGSNSSGSSSAGTGGARPLRILPLLNLLTTRLYPLLFSRPADSLEQSTQNSNEYMIIDNTPLTNTYISVPKEMSQLSVAAYIAGVIEGVCDGAGFGCKVSAHNVKDDTWPNKTVFLVKFDDWVMEREKELERLAVK